jgi:outer membrane protein assembly factor BamB
MQTDAETGEYQGIYACNAQGWSSSNIEGSALATSQVTVLLTPNGELMVLDNLANSVRWLDHRPGISRLLGLTGDRLGYSTGDRVRAVDIKSGLLHWEVAASPDQAAEAILHGGSIRVAGPGGNQLQVSVATGDIQKLNAPTLRGRGVVAGDGIIRVWRDGLTVMKPKVTFPPAEHWKRTAMRHLVKRVVRNDEGYDRSKDLKELFTKGGPPEKALAHLLTMEDARSSGNDALAKASAQSLLGMSKEVMTLSDGRVISPSVSGGLFAKMPEKTSRPVLEADSAGALVPLWSVPGAGIAAVPNPDGTFVAIQRGTQVQLRLADEQGSLIWARNFDAEPSLHWAKSHLLVRVGKEAYALDIRDSSLLWRRDNCERIFTHKNSSVLITQEGGHVYGIDSASGRQLWEADRAGAFNGQHFRDIFVSLGAGLRVLDVQTGKTRLQTDLAIRKPNFTEDIPVVMHRNGNSIFCVRGDRGRAIEYDLERNQLVWSKVLSRMSGTARLLSNENFLVISSDFAASARVAVVDRQKKGMFLTDQPSASAVSLNQGLIAYERFTGLGLMEVKSGYRPKLKRIVKHVLPDMAYRNFIMDENWVVTARRGLRQWHFCLYRPEDIRITSQFALRDLPQWFDVCGRLLLVGTPSDLVAFAAPAEKGIEPSAALAKSAEATGDAGEIAREIVAAQTPREVDLFVTSTEIQLDGNLADWKGLPVLKFGGNHYNALPPTTLAEPRREHREDKDLSAEIFICENERSVLIGAAIRDDVHRPAHTWPLESGDCLQVELAGTVSDEETRKFQRKVWTFVVDGGKSLMSAVPSSGIRFAGRRQGDKTIYEAAIPRSLAGELTYLNVTARDRDGNRVHGITSLAPVRPTSPGRSYFAVVKRINDVVGSADRSMKLLKLFPEADGAPRLVETIVRMIPSANPFDQKVKVHRDAIAIYPGSRWTPHFLSRIEAALQAKGNANSIDETLKAAQSLKVPKAMLDRYQAAPRLSQRVWVDKLQPTRRLEVRLMEDRSGSTPITWGRVYWSARPDVPAAAHAVYMGKLPGESEWQTLTANLLALPQKSSKVGGMTYYNRLGKVIWGATTLTGTGKDLEFGLRDKPRGEEYWGWYWLKDKEIQGHTTPFQLHGFWLQQGLVLTSVPVRTRPQEINEAYRGRLLEAHRLCGNSPAGRAYLQRLLGSLPEDKEGYARRFALIAGYLKRTPNGAFALQLAHSLRGWAAGGLLDGGPERIAALLREAGTEMSLRRSFHQQYTAVPTGWQVLGPLDGDVAGWTRRTRVPRSRGGNAPVRIGRSRLNWSDAANLVKGRLVTPAIHEEDQIVFLLTEFQCKLGAPASLFLSLGHGDMQAEVFLNGRLVEQVVAYRDGNSAVIPVQLRFGRNILILKLGLSARSVSARKDLPFTAFIASEDGAPISTIEYEQ